MAPNVNSATSFSRLDGINSNGLNKEISQQEPKFVIKKITAKEHRVITFAPPYICIRRSNPRTGRVSCSFAPEAKTP